MTVEYYKTDDTVDEKIAAIVDGEEVTYTNVTLTPVEDLDPMEDELFVSYLRDNRLLKMYREAFVAAVDDRAYWRLRIKYPEQFISGAFLWHKTPKGADFWSKYNDIWRKLASSYRNSILKSALNEEKQLDNDKKTPTYVGF